MFQINQKVRVMAPGRWEGRVGTIWELTSYDTARILFNPWLAPKTHKGVSQTVAFRCSQLVPYVAKGFN